jgi:hypothetical protein
MLVLIKVYDYVRSFAALRSGAARSHGQDVLSLEKFLHVDIEHSANHWLSGTGSLQTVAAYWYQYAHITGTMVVLVWCYVSAPMLYRRARNALVITNIVGMTVFILYPVMPPRLLPGEHFVDTLQWAGFQSAHYANVKPDEYAAMPSLHLSWAFWTALVAVSLVSATPARRYRWFVMIYPMITATVVVTTANHYVSDVVAGIFVATVATWATGQLLPDRPVPLARPYQVIRQRAENAQMIRLRSRKANTVALGSNGSQTVSSRYPTTAATASVSEIEPMVEKASGSATSSAPTPPGEGTRALNDETTT